MLCPLIVSFSDKKASFPVLVCVVLISTVLSLLLLVLGYCSRAADEQIQQEMAMIDSTNPQTEARKAIQAGDLRLIALPSFRRGSKGEKAGRLDVPGIGEFDEGDPDMPASRQLKCVVGLVLSNEAEKQYWRALQYAEDYNHVILESRAQGRP